MEILMDSDLENLSLSDKKDYYKRLREKCLLLKDKQLHVGQGLIKNFYPLFRGYKLELEGVENIPVDSNVLFLFNHSNSHDIFTAYEILSQLQRKGSVMVATDCLNPITTEIFNISNATLLDRRNKEERHNSIYTMSSKILSGNDGVIFGESTWNIHPTLIMHNIRRGVSAISAITQVPVIPTIVEYIEKDEFIKSESDLYKKCLIRFGKPIMIDYDSNLIAQTDIIKNSMIEIRNQIWRDYSIKRTSLSDIDPSIYINHTYIKKFKAFGFTYDSQKEQEYLLFLENEKKENEYTLDDNGNLIPGITEKNFELKKLLHK